MDIEALRSGYKEFYAEASAGGFGPPPEGEWTAEFIVAHIAANDDLLSTTTSQVLAGGDAQGYYNHDVIDNARLAVLVADRSGDLTSLVAWGREASDRLCALADELADRGDTLVHTHIVDGDTVVADQPLPWAAVLDIHAQRHLRRHIAQLRALRG